MPEGVNERCSKVVDLIDEIAIVIKLAAMIPVLFFPADGANPSLAI